MEKKTRLEYNRQIIAVLAEAVERFPQWRFHQLLQNFNVTDPADQSGTDKWFEESKETFETLNIVGNG